MSNSIPKEILDELTNVKMPGRVPGRKSEESIVINGLKIPVFQCTALVAGSGAAGNRAAVEMKRRNIDVVIASTGLYSGTSACSGSDKQTLHTAGTSNNGDNFNKLASDIGSGGCMDKDTAYVEATGSLNAFSGLQYMGLPLPQDRFGAVLRYQTDHDDVGRATSCGPRTSRLMVKVLTEEAIRLGVPYLQGTTVVKILYRDQDAKKGLAGVLAVSREENSNPYSLIYIACSKLVLATGGPGELYRDSVYPHKCYGSLGMAIEAGLEVVNLTESQFGIGTRREDFPWNLSGTYVQVIPYIYSVDEQGKECNFLADYYRTTQELVSNVFRKGYQWPFHATRMSRYGSSLLDLAVYVESKKGRTVYMDFNRNPEAVPGDEPFSLERLDEDVFVYLKNNEAMQEMPIDRLLRMNPLAIELYKMHGTDLNTEPLAFNVNNQHMNGGVNVSIWGQSSHEDIYAVGEVAGTHGVTRPGGAALNAGQVFGTRCATHLASRSLKSTAWNRSDVEKEIENVLKEIALQSEADSGYEVEDLKSEVQSRMSDEAGFICQKNEVKKAYKDAVALRKRVSEDGLKLKSDKLSDYFQWKQMVLTSEAVLMALHHYVENGGGSRGARAICAGEGTVVPEARNQDLSEYRYIEEQEDDMGKKIVITYREGGFSLKEVPLREMEDPGTIFFEKNWASYLTDEVCENEFKHT